MSELTYVDDQDRLERSLNSFATQSLRDQADRDYILARLACQHELFPQFLWSSHQAIEKYLKAILLYNRIPATNVLHKLSDAMTLAKQLPFNIELSPSSRKFIDHLSVCGEYRYIDVPYYISGYIITDLDISIWELRRYCQVLNVFGKELPLREQDLLEKAWSDLARSSTEPRYRFRLQDGFLEKVLEDPKHPSRPALLWQNASYGVRARKTVRVKNHLHAQNPYLYLNPEMLEELLKYVYIPKKLKNAYREHLADIKADSQDPK